jgi:hypothetical protein
MTHPVRGYAIALTLSLLAWGLAAMLATQALGYSTSDYCRDVVLAERQHCHSTHAADLADCAFTRALERWLGVDGAQRNATECRNEAEEACRECKRAADECGVVR